MTGRSGRQAGGLVLELWIVLKGQNEGGGGVCVTTQRIVSRESHIFYSMIYVSSVFHPLLSQVSMTGKLK